MRLLLAVLLVASATGCLAIDPASESLAGPASPPAAEGRHERLLDEALERFDEPVTAERRSWAEDLLASLVEEAAASGSCTDCTQRAIVERMLQLPSEELTFEQAVRFALLDLGREELYEERS